MAEKPENKEFTRTCLCGETDQRLVVFCTQVGFGIMSASFFMVQLARGADTAIYLPLLTSIFGYFMPAPSLKK